MFDKRGQFFFIPVLRINLLKELFSFFSLSYNFRIMPTENGNLQDLNYGWDTSMMDPHYHHLSISLYHQKRYITF